MAHIEAELNLNKTPQIVKNNSLIFAKNIKFGKDKSIMRDDKIDLVDIFVDTINQDIINEYDNLEENIKDLQSQIDAITETYDIKSIVTELYMITVIT